YVVYVYPVPFLAAGRHGEVFAGEGGAEGGRNEGVGKLAGAIALEDGCAGNGPALGAAVHLAEGPGSGFTGGVDVHGGLLAGGAADQEAGGRNCGRFKAGFEQVERAVEVVAEGGFDAEEGVVDANG